MRGMQLPAARARIRAGVRTRPGGGDGIGLGATGACSVIYSSSCRTTGVRAMQHSTLQWVMVGVVTHTPVLSGDMCTRTHTARNKPNVPQSNV